MHCGSFHSRLNFPAIYMFSITAIIILVALSYTSRAVEFSGLRATPTPDMTGIGPKRQTSLALDQVLDGRNLTAVVVGAKALSNNTIQVVLEANITSPSMTPQQLPVPGPAREKLPDRLHVRLIYGAGDNESISILKSPDFVNFFTRPLILNNTNLELIPYGRTTEIDVNTLSPGFLFWHPELRRGNITRVYRCPNGESECESNLIHSCAIRVSQNDPTIFLPFIACMSNAPRGTSPEDSSFSCSNSTKFMESLKDCALGSDGIELQHSLAHEAIGVPAIPSIFIDGLFHPFNFSGSVDLPGAFCDLMFAKGMLDRDLCEGGKDRNKLSAPFESLLTPVVTSGHVNSKVIQ